MMGIIRKVVNNRNVFLVAVLAATASQAAFGAGFEEAISMITTIRSWIYGVVGVVAGLALLYQCLEGWSGRKQWLDVGITAAWIFVAAAAISIAAWIWSKGGSVTF